MKHTPEPWYINPSFGFSSILGPDHRSIATLPVVARPFKESDANLERIVACVNACKGIKDPEATLPAMREALRAASQDLKSRSVVDNIIYSRDHPGKSLPEPPSLSLIRDVLSLLQD